MAVNTRNNSDGPAAGAAHEGLSGSQGHHSSGQASGSGLNAEIARLVKATVKGQLS